MWFRLPYFLLWPGLVLATVALASFLKSADPGWLTRDPAALNGTHPLTGAMSHLGVLLWCACASVCLFAAGRLTRSAQAEEARWFFAAGALTMVLLFDDLFLVHDDLAARYLGHGESAVLTTLMAATLAYLLRFRRCILRGERRLLVLALASFSLSVALDFGGSFGWLGSSGWRFFAEDAPKFLGIAAWCAYHWQAAGRSLGETRVGPAQAG